MIVGPSSSRGHLIALVATLSLVASTARAQFTWDGVTHASFNSAVGSNTLGNGSTLAASTASNHDFNGVALINNGTVNWQSGAGALRTGNGGSFTNNNIFNDAAATTSGTTSVVNNALGGTVGTFTNSSGANYNKSSAGTTEFDLPFNNSGTVTISAGTLNLANGGALAGGATISAGTGAAVQFSGSTYTLSNNSSLAGTGTAQLSNGTLNATGNVTVSNFQFNGGTLTGSPTFFGNLTWNASSWSDSGTTTTIDSTATLNLASGNNHDFNGHAVVNNGTANWQAGAGPIRSGNSGTFTNNGNFNDAAANATSATAFVNNAFGGTMSTFTNANGATYTKTSAGTTEFDVPFNNSGTVSINGGTLTLNGGGTLAGSGTMSVGSGASVVFSNSYTLVNGASLSGAGNFSAIGGTFNVTGTVNVFNFQLNGAALTGTQTFNGTLAWNNGNLNDSGTTTTIGSGATLNLTSGNNHDFNGHALVNGGIVNWQSGAGPLRSGNSGTFTNNGNFNDAAATTSGTIAVVNNAYGGTTSSFINSVGANYTKSSAGTTEFDVPFNNSGNVVVSAGTLNLVSGGTLASAATVSAASGAQVQFSGGTYVLSNNSSLTGAGTAQLTGGTLNATGNVTVANFQFNGGNLTGSPTFFGNLTWNGSNWSDSGTTTTIDSTATLNLASGSNHDFNSHAVVNNGTANWQAGAGPIRSGNSGTFTNNGNFNDAAANATNITAAVNNAYGGTTSSFTNSNGATYTKTSVGTTQFDVPFNNSGTVSVNGGTLTLNGGGTLAGSGTMSVGAGAGVVFSNSYTLVNGASLAGAGNFSATGGTFTVGGTVNVSNFQLSGATLAGTQTFNGTLAWNNGNLNDSGTTTTIGSGATLTIASGNNHDFNAHAVTNNGTVSWAAGSGPIRSGNSGLFSNNGLFLDAAANVVNAIADINNAYGGTAATFTNASGATYRKTSVGTTTMSLPFVNSGTIDTQAGTLQLLSTSTFNAGTTQTGTGLLELLSGTLTASGAMTFSNFQIAGGTVSGNHTFSGNVEWTNGNFNSSSSSTTVAGTTTIDSGNNHDFNTHTFINSGTVNWVAGAGPIRTGNSATFTNNGVFNDAASNAFNNAYGGTVATFTNGATGTYNKTAAGTTTFDVGFVNSGALNVQAGTLALNAGGSSPVNAAFSVSPGATLSFTGGSFAAASGAGFTGAGTVNLNGGTLTLGANVAAPAFSLTGGTLAGSQNFLGHVTWTNGNFNDSGTTTTIASGAILDIASSNNHDFSTHALVNNGTVNWQTGAGPLRSGNAGSFTNNAIFNDTASNQMNNAYGGTTSTFTNAASGTYNKTAGTTTFSVPFTNSGAINANGGTLQLAGGGTITNGASFNGTGQVQLTGGTFTASGNFTSTSLVVAGVVVTGTYSLGGGTLTFSSGSLQNSAFTIASGANVAFSTANNFDFPGASITNNGTFNWSAGAGPIRSGNSGVFTNNSNFLDTASNVMNNAYGGTVAQFVNTATGNYNKSTASQTTVQIPFTNSGTVTVVGGGSLVLDAGGTITNGAKFLGAGQTMLDAGSFATSGTINSVSLALTGTAVVSGNSTFSGNFTWNGGNFNNSDTTTFAPGALVQVSTSATHDFSAHSLVNQGIVNWSGGDLRSGNSGSFLNQSNGIFNDSANANVTNAYGGTVATFTNSGIYNKTAGTTAIQLPFTNNASPTNGVFVNGGTLHFANSFTETSGSILVANGATAQFDQSLAFAAGSLGGRGTLAIAGNLSLLSTSVAFFQLGGTTAGADFGFISVTGTTALGGATLGLGLTNGFVPTSGQGQTFTLLTSTGGLSGTFANVANGQSFFFNNVGSFQVNYGIGSAFAPNSLVLSNFVPVPEPATWSLLALGAGAVLLGVRRRARR